MSVYRAHACGLWKFDVYLSHCITAYQEIPPCISGNVDIAHVLQDRDCRCSVYFVFISRTVYRQSLVLFSRANTKICLLATVSSWFSYFLGWLYTHFIKLRSKKSTTIFIYCCFRMKMSMYKVWYIWSFCNFYFDKFSRNLVNNFDAKKSYLPINGDSVKYTKTIVYFFVCYFL